MHSSEEYSKGAQCVALCGDACGFTKVALVQDLYIAPEKKKKEMLFQGDAAIKL